MMIYSLYMLFGRCDVVRIERIISKSGHRIVTVLTTGKQQTTRLANLYGSFKTEDDARKAADGVNAIHKKHAARVARHLTAHTEAVRARNNDMMNYLRTL